MAEVNCNRQVGSLRGRAPVKVVGREGGGRPSGRAVRSVRSLKIIEDQNVL